MLTRMPMMEKKKASALSIVCIPLGRGGKEEALRLCQSRQLCGDDSQAACEESGREEVGPEQNVVMISENRGAQDCDCNDEHPDVGEVFEDSEGSEDNTEHACDGAFKGGVYDPT